MELAVPPSSCVVHVTFSPEEAIAHASNIFTSANDTKANRAVCDPRDKMHISHDDDIGLRMHSDDSDKEEADGDKDSYISATGQSSGQISQTKTRSSFLSWVKMDPSPQSASETSSSGRDVKSDGLTDRSMKKMRSPVINKRLRDAIDLTRQVYQMIEEEASKKRISRSKNKFVLSIPVFAINKKWLDMWLNNMSSDPPIESIPPIENRHLIDAKQGNAQSDNGFLKTLEGTLKPDIDYCFVAMEVWSLLSNRYGSDVEIPIKVTVEMNVDTSKSEESSGLAASSSRTRLSNVQFESVADNCITISNSVLASLVEGAYIIESADSNTSNNNRNNSNNSNGDGNYESKPPSVASTATEALFEGYIWRDCGNDEKTVQNEKSHPIIIHGKKSNRMLCFVCHSPAPYKCSHCKLFHYCSQECLKIHWIYHSSICPKLEKSSDEKIKITSCRDFASNYLKVSGLGRRGRAGVYNIGNSCYLSSALQCLVRITPINHYLLSERYKALLNLDNPMGTRGRLANEYHHILKRFWLDPTVESIQPATFKRLLGEINADYGDLSQQDSHDVTQTILEKIHEDLNKVKGKKPFVEKFEKIIKANEEASYAVSDEEIATRCWEDHLKREDSVIQDAVGGLVKVHTRCLTCRSRKITFDYQQSVQLAIPPLTSGKLPFTVIPWLGPNQSINNSDKHRVVPLSMPMVVVLPVNLSGNFDKFKESIFENLSDLIMDDDLDNRRTNSDGRSSSLKSYFNKNSSAFENCKDKQASYKQVLFERFRLLRLPMATSLQCNYFHKIEQIDTARNRYIIAEFGPDNKSSILVYTIHRMINAETSESKVACCPIFANVDPHTTLEDLRTHLFQQVERFLNKKCALWSKYQERCSSVGVQIAQLEMSHFLDISMLDKSGNPLYPEGAVPKGSLGHPLPKFQEAKKITLLQFLNSNFERENKNVSFMSINWHLAHESPVRWSANILDLNSVLAHSSASKLVPELSTQDSRGYKYPWQSVPCKNLNFAIPFQEPLTLDMLFKEYIKSETLSGSDAVYCGAVCKSHQPHERYFRLFKSRLPETLIIHFKRFEVRDIPATQFSAFFPTSNRFKLDDFIDFPLEGLDVATYCEMSTASSLSATSTSDSSSSPAAAAVPIPLTDNSTKYDLFGVVNHYGRLGFGHYTAFVRDYCRDRISSSWIEADDSRTSAATEVVTKDAYILFYRKKS